MTSKSNKLGSIREHYTFPETKPNFAPFYWSLDGGGRDTIVAAAEEGNVQIILEVGVFLGGSVVQWLEALPTVIVVGVDPYGFDCASFYRKYKHVMPTADFGEMSEDGFLEQMERDDAQYLSAMTNLWNYQDRFVPVRGSSPDILYRLHELGLKADLCYLDSDKKGLELEVFRELWPNAIICGDDWDYMTDIESGVYDIRESVFPFAEKHGLQVHATDASWVLKPPLKKSFWKRIFSV